MRAWLCAVVAVAACGGGSGTGDDDPQADAAVDAPGDGSTPVTWTSLIERGWQLDPSAERFKCVRKRIDTDTYINGFRLDSTFAPHFVILTISTGPALPNGPYDCDGAKVDAEMLYAGGVGSGDVVFPEGVAVKIPAGSYINLNIQLMNTGTGYVNGSTAIDVLRVPASEVVHEADMIFLGTRVFTIPPTNQPQNKLGSCSVPAEWNVVALWPRMHRYGTHQTVRVKRAGAPAFTDVLDVDYSYSEQKSYPMQSLALHINDTFEVQCTYVNNTNVTYPPNGFDVQYGESANVFTEQCFTGFYKWPADNLDRFYCAPL
jgi:hypothetical protein